MTRVLIATLSCVAHAMNGYHQVMRDTWLKDVDLFYMQHLFFIGNGRHTGEDETLLWKSWDESGVYKQKVVSDPDLSNCDLQNDEVILDVSDSYTHVGYKLRGACQWALKNGYDYIFQTIIDTFVFPDRLLASGFEQYDYVGSANNERTALGGGAGFWLSSKAMRALINEPVTNWAYDGWCGEVMRKKGIKLTHDPRYTNLEQSDPPMKDNDAITSHIANTPAIYDPKVMFELYEQARDIYEPL
jgi:hypothetical protein